ncbi:hypothetical protein [Brucella pituitosa]|uniref:hypothetical protein n=1 Tax=Brucella pituitosa TaxID=571256 RepID=UPI000C280B12|nr:hypothetical protein [Brucella pituitosa]PJO49348.1 hypothetical protein CWE02_06135 [Brucella pituitosa]
MILNKTIFVQAFHKKLWKEEAIDVPTGEVRKGVFGREKPVQEKNTQLVHVGFSDCEIDGARLASDVQSASEQLQAEGFELVSLTPVISGNRANGYGCSFTEGVIMISQKEHPGRAND